MKVGRGLTRKFFLFIMGTKHKNHGYAPPWDPVLPKRTRRRTKLILENCGVPADTEN